MDFTINIVRSKRKTLALYLQSPGAVLVRAPLTVTESEIQAFVLSHEGWIAKQSEKLKKREDALGEIQKLTESELSELYEKAKVYIPQRVAFYAEKMGVSYKKITIRFQKTRWGSCSAKGNLNFNCLLMFTPAPVIDSVVVHELCHLKHLNHSKAFYREVLLAYPDYFSHHAWLKENGAALLKRVYD